MTEPTRHATPDTERTETKRGGRYACPTCGELYWIETCAEWCCRDAQERGGMSDFDSIGTQ